MRQRHQPWNAPDFSPRRRIQVDPFGYRTSAGSEIAMHQFSLTASPLAAAGEPVGPAERTAATVGFHAPQISFIQGNLFLPASTPSLPPASLFDGANTTTTLIRVVQRTSPEPGHEPPKTATAGRDDHIGHVALAYCYYTANPSDFNTAVFITATGVGGLLPLNTRKHRYPLTFPGEPSGGTSVKRPG